MTQQEALEEARIRGWTAPWTDEALEGIDHIGPRFVVGSDIFELRGASDDSFEAAFADADRRAASQKGESQ